MGLPLFIAPVESDLPSKAADKSTSPSRSGIRRHARPDSRERRAALRRQISIRDRFAALESSSLSSDSHFAMLRDQRVPRARPFREVLREMARSDDRQRERFEEQLHSLFTGNPLRERDSLNELDGNGFLRANPIPPATRTRIAGTQPRADSQPRSRQTALSALTASHGGLRRTARDDPALLSAPGLTAIEDRRNEALQRLRDVNGLGDRDRSVSPEVWDTLLSTLTPDPQPPSAGSSFASTVASQNAGATSGSSLPRFEDIPEDFLMDHPCDSGCENSDTEDFDRTPEVLRRHRRRREEERERRRVRVRVPDYNLDGASDRMTTDGLNYVSVNLGAGSDSSTRPMDSGSLHSWWVRDRATTQRESDSLTETAAPYGDMAVSQLHGPRHGWIGHLSVGTSDDEQGAERRSLNRESSTASGIAGEEDWHGMQRIVRGLARREDIPDEWWAEAGLSRTLPRDGTE